MFEWEVRRDVRPGAGLAVDVERAAESLDAVGQADQAGTTRGIGPADTVVADR